MSVKAIERKKLEVEALVERMKTANSFVIVDYSGLTVEQVTRLRRELRENGCEMAVIKNNITRRAASELGFNELEDALVGPNAVAFSHEDSVSAAKVIYDFALQNKALELKVGVVDGEYMDNENINVIATIPSRETLLTMIASGILQPIKEVAIALDLMAQEMESPQELESPQE
ncbi:50S ribosomal protein L10 [Candidatus Xianfuyuplasma coldseepsis]|uniref:Large ribosomal subunit protein uL10 n=1 Tax=Candidatus Xianfuyuplasma coldseepsis TaxID=2782163 RepID=A0A7L7KSZ6_9MOLU|nr:50S ribosomal protein L10 [Xianfuyuplasma coldseepsis]QMS85356.1 50S ribosomal protein L10 [Xianfuyuplasma coldseepsis]